MGSIYIYVYIYTYIYIGLNVEYRDNGEENVNHNLGFRDKGSEFNGLGLRFLSGV